MADGGRAAAYCSSEANRVTREWLGACENNHNICGKSMTPSGFVLPRRLIDIGNPGSTNPFLVETAFLVDKSFRYVALSHRWGDPNKLLQTVASNISKHYEGIAWDALPRTLQDAIIVSQCLGVRYLWIDSLCIIQKDRIDFEQECSSMHLIYLHSYCMIAASDAQDASQGFLHLWKEHHTDIASPGLQDSTLVQAFQPPSPEFRSSKYLKYAEWTRVLDGSLNARAWAYQERQLSPRILHFTTLGIMWECRLSIGAGDSSWLQLKRTAIYQHRFSYLIPQTKIFRMLDLDRSRLTLDDLMEMWLYKVEEYSLRQLSFLDDKLPALSGLAATIGSGTRDSLVLNSSMYLAGAWASDIARQLFWCPKFSTVTEGSALLQPTSTQENSLPTWTWASCDSPVMFYDTFSLLEIYCLIRRSGFSSIAFRQLEPHPAFEYISTNIVPTGLDPFGRIQGDQLRVHGAFFEQDVSTVMLTSKDGRRISRFRERLGPRGPCDCASLARQLNKDTRWTYDATEHTAGCEGKTPWSSCIFFDACSSSVERVALKFLFLLRAPGKFLIAVLFYKPTGRIHSKGSVSSLLLDWTQESGTCR
jgi:hypothetical protein